ncbi:hypothetical protein WICPIJ_007173 [Wickerhamomyces pijperi]|uniref:MARVEL domain-containing protein n=1 Tax=Wickerhamomyces pijperi TaxID=599730 RepID=A0A9P8Q2D4_WICPI|nr:hypothetical protein WICPIJ_007173 [Wickerhamomyces pijperi]
MAFLSTTNVILRGVNFVFLVIILGLTGSLIQSQDPTNSRVNFALFAAVFGLVTDSFYGVAAYFVEALAWPLILLTFNFLNFVFTLSAGSALAAGLRVHSCNNEEYLLSNNVAQGSTDRCRKGQASTAFLFFSMALFIGSLAVQAIQVSGSGLFSSGSRSSKRAGVPTITTV